jgi:hypothetical protein
MQGLAIAVRNAFGTLLLVAVAGCLPDNPAPPPQPASPLFDPIVFFAGRTHGEGALRLRGRAARTLRVEGVGRTDTDGTFQLDQAVTYADGAVETRTWRMRRVDAGHYLATLSDAKGEVQAEASGNMFHLRYLIRQPAVYMEQRLYLAADGRSVVNQAQVTVLGVPWARLAETITREGSPRE